MVAAEAEAEVAAVEVAAVEAEEAEAVVEVVVEAAGAFPG